MKSTIIAILIGISMLFAPCIGVAADVALESTRFNPTIVDVHKTAAPEAVQPYGGAPMFEVADALVHAPAAGVGASNAGQVHIPTDVVNDERRAHPVAESHVSAALTTGVHDSPAPRQRNYAFVYRLGPSGKCAPARAFEPCAFASVSDSGLVIRSIL